MNSYIYISCKNLIFLSCCASQVAKSLHEAGFPYNQSYVTAYRGCSNIELTESQIASLQNHWNNFLPYYNEVLLPLINVSLAELIVLKQKKTYRINPFTLTWPFSKLFLHNSDSGFIYLPYILLERCEEAFKSVQTLMEKYMHNPAAVEIEEKNAARIKLSMLADRLIKRIKSKNIRYLLRYVEHFNAQANHETLFTLQEINEKKPEEIIGIVKNSYMLLKETKK